MTNKNAEIFLQLFLIGHIFGYLILFRRKNKNLHTCVAILNVVKVGQKFLLPVGNNLDSFVKFRRLPGGHTCHIKRATCNILIFLRNIVILRKSGGEKVNIFLK